MLENALTGPVILVSHGGAAFPDVVVVLQGEGVVLDLTGNTFITHSITSSKFDTVPDAPISSFELRLPRGPHSALASSVGGFCGRQSDDAHHHRGSERRHPQAEHEDRHLRLQGHPASPRNRPPRNRAARQEGRLTQVCLTRARCTFADFP